MKDIPIIDARHPDEVVAEEEIDLREYWRVISKHKWGIFGFTFVVALLAVLVAFSLTPLYRSTATLLIEAQAANVVSIEEVYGIPGANREYYQTQFEILKSRDLTERVIRRFALDKHPEFDPEQQEGFNLDWRKWIPEGLLPPAEPPTKEELHDQVVQAFLERLSVSPIRNSQLVKIGFEANDAEMAALVANAMADAYIESNMEAKLAMTQKAAGWLTERMDGLRIKLQESERSLQDFREREELVDVAGVKSVAAKELDELAEKLAEARQKRAETEAIYNQARALRGQPVERLEVIPAVLRHPVIQDLKENEAEAERKVSELAKRYGPRHPKMIAAKSELKTARQSINTQIRKIVDGISKEYEVAKAHEADLMQTMNASKKDVQSINRKEYELGVLQREVQTNRQLYDLFLTRFKETSAAGDVQTPIARVVDPAVVATKPSKPKKKLIVLIAVLLGGFVAVALAFLLEYLDNTMKTVEDLERRLDLTVLGMLPKLKTRGKKDRSPLRHFLDDSKSPFAESVRTVRTGVLLSSLDNPHKTIVVTSSVPGEGKTTVSMNLAAALGGLSKVLLIDADMRRPSVAGALGLDSAAPGLSHYTAGTAQISECVHHLEERNVYVMPSGIVPPNPLELLSSNRFAEALEKLSQAFDHIVIDAAPALAVSDAMVLSRHASAVIYVVKADDTPYQAAQTGVKRLHQVNAPLIGAVLNMVPERKGGYGRYGYYSGGGYYSHYGYNTK